MVLFIFRGLFIVMSVGVASLYATRAYQSEPVAFLVSVVLALAISAGLVVLDIYTPEKRLSAVSGAVLGLIVGMILAYAMGFLVEYVGVVAKDVFTTTGGATIDAMVQGLKVFVGVICVFASISLILQTKDDFRFVIPYVELSKKIRGNRPTLLDTSAIIDGRILDIAQTQILQGLLVVPRFVINELQTISDSQDKLKRARGRRGLDIVAKLQSQPLVEMTIEDAIAEGATVDQMLVSLAQEMNARLITTDFNLAKVAKLRSIDVINLNELAGAMKPVVLPGETMSVKIMKPGESANQGVGYLEDGTMVVVEQARSQVGQVIDLTVTSMLQTSAGRMIFGKYDGPGETSGESRNEPAPAPAGSAQTSESAEPRESYTRNPRRSRS